MKNQSPLAPVESYIESAAARTAARDIRVLTLSLPSLSEKARQARLEGRDGLCRHISIMIDILSSPKVAAITGTPPRHLAELAVAANYLVKGEDMIPDCVGNIGLSDDELVASTVFRRNRKLSARAIRPASAAAQSGLRSKK